MAGMTPSKRSEDRILWIVFLAAVAVCIVTLIVGGLFIKETKDHHIEA